MPAELPAQARWLRSQAARRSLELRLQRETAEAFGRYQAARQQVAKLHGQVVPKLQESAELVRKAFDDWRSRAMIPSFWIGSSGSSRSTRRG